MVVAKPEDPVDDNEGVQNGIKSLGQFVDRDSIRSEVLLYAPVPFLPQGAQPERPSISAEGATALAEAMTD